MSLSRFRYAAAAAVLVLLASTGATVAADAATGPPQLDSFTYAVAPYARVGWVDHPIATIMLSAPAQGDTSVTVSSDDPSVASVPATVTVLDGQSYATVPVTGVSEGTATLTASLGAVSLVLTPPLQVAGPAREPNLSTLSVDPPSVQPGDPATGWVVLDFLAPPGGTSVALASDNPSATVPVAVTVPEDQDRAYFDITTTSGPSAVAVITATLGSVTRTYGLQVADTLPPDTAITGLSVSRAKRLATVRFTSTEAGSTFRCRLDGGGWKACTSPRTYRRLAVGRHAVRVRAVDGAGNADPSAALRRFRIRR